MPAFKDRDGDYWVQYLTDDELFPLIITGDGAAPWIGGTAKADEVSIEYGPLTAVYLDITEVAVPDISRVCDACLYDHHFCYECDDAVSHSHVHTEG